MAAADIGAGNSRYTGNSGIGGGSFGSFQLDLGPVQDAARYAMLYNKAEFDQRQINADEKIKLIAENTAFDPNTAIDRDKEQARKIYNDLIEKGNEYARKSPATAEEKVKQNWEYKTQIADSQKAINSIKGRAIAYNARMEAIKTNPAYTDAQKKQKIDQLNKDADSDVYTPIAIEDKFDETIPTVKDVVPRKIVVSSILDNNNITHDITVVTSTDLLRQSQREATGMESIFSGENKDFFQASNDPYKVFQNAAEAYNVAISDPRYQSKDADGSVIIDYELIKRENPLLAGVGSLLDDYNKWASDMKAQATNGVFTDRLGKTYQSIQGVSPDDFFTIDKNKPLTGDQMVMLEKWRKASGKLLTTDEKLTPTGDALDRERLRLTKRGQDLDYKVAWHNANKPSGGAGANSGGGITTPAILFGEHVNRVKNFYSKNPKGDLTVSYKALDDKTIAALNIDELTLLQKDAPEDKKKAEEKRVIYKPDGSFIVEIKNNGGWENVRSGTPEDLKQGFIDVVKRGTTQTEGFQDKSEEGFNAIFGTTSGSMIFNGWDNKPTPAKTSPGKTETPEERAKRIANEK